MKDIGKRLQLLRKQQKISRTKLAEMSGISPRTIQNYETGTSKPKVESVEKLAAALGQSARYLMYGIKTEPKEHIEGRQEVLRMVADIFESDTLSEDDKLAFLTEIQAIYLNVKRKSMEESQDDGSSGTQSSDDLG
ncbi:MAG: helix-turn-helix transcriptional regulator [Ruminococcus sp.]|uniref:helix-turn-helix domain-containing protein n=1 Tax=Ruminococcus sp. TaxID=41978 RepID=UPI002872EB2B|nr:helix-turn-helix transcriptional regulator [Ruminococcus sp.]MBQ3285175.1 helix-turn-helix transcriptional regulator [Ruminococcus sp.]